MEAFFKHENQAWLPSLSEFGELRSGAKATLISCLKTQRLVVSPVQGAPPSLACDAPAVANEDIPDLSDEALHSMFEDNTQML